MASVILAFFVRHSDAIFLDKYIQTCLSIYFLFGSPNACFFCHLANCSFTKRLMMSYFFIYSECHLRTSTEISHLNLDVLR